MVAVRLDVPPELRWRRARRLRQIADQHRIHRIRDVHERRAIVAPDQRVLATRLRIRPAPVVVGAHAAGVIPRAQHRDRHERQQLDVLAVERAHPAIRARPFLSGHRLQRVGRAQQRARILPPAGSLTRVQVHRTGAVVHPRRRHDREPASRHDPITEAIPFDGLLQSDATRRPPHALPRRGARVHVDAAGLDVARGRCSHPDIAARDADRAAESVAGRRALRIQPTLLQPRAAARVTAVNVCGTAAILAPRLADHHHVAVERQARAERTVRLQRRRDPPLLAPLAARQHELEHRTGPLTRAVVQPRRPDQRALRRHLDRTAEPVSV